MADRQRELMDVRILIRSHKVMLARMRRELAELEEREQRLMSAGTQQVEMFSMKQGAIQGR